MLIYDKSGRELRPQNFITFLCCGDIDHTRKPHKAGPSDGDISTTKKDNKIPFVVSFMCTII